MSSQQNDSIKLSINFEISTKIKFDVDTPDIMVKY